MFFSRQFFFLGQIPKIKICHMVAGNIYEVIEGRQRLIYTDVTDPEEAYQYGSIDDDCVDFYKECESGLGEAGVSIDVIGAGTKEVEEVQNSVKYSYLQSYMLKPPSLLTQGFKYNNLTQQKLFKCMYKFGAQSEWSSGRRYVSSYIDVDTIKYQYSLLNTNHLGFISGYIIQDAVGDRYLRNLLWQSMNFIDGSISSYLSILNSPERLHIITQVNKLTSFFGDIQSDHLEAKEDINNRERGSKYQRNNKAEQNQMRDDYGRSKIINNCEVLVRSVLTFGVDHIKNLKGKGLGVLLIYHFGL